MRLAELACACYIYGQMTDYDRSYDRLRKFTRPWLDLENAQHRLALIQWLREWSCRQFVDKYRDLASEEIRKWYQKYGHRLPSLQRSLLDLTREELKVVEEAYADLAVRLAGRKNRHDGGLNTVTIGPTGAAKILFALRPQALAPWDDSIRKHFQLDGSAAAYRRYLDIVRKELEELDGLCRRVGYQLSDLPTLLNRRISTPVKLIDEYFWITVSKGCRLPTRDEFQAWAKWW